MAVAAGRLALGRDGDPDADAAVVRRVVLVTRDPALLDGGSAAVLLAGLGLGLDTACVELLGGAPATLDALAAAGPDTLVIAADLDPAGSAAALVGEGDTPSVLRVSRSLPVLTRSTDGVVRDYGDERLMRERGLGVSLEWMGLQDRPVAVAGLAAKQAGALCAAPPPKLPTTGASSTLFAVAAMAEQRLTGLLLAVEQATASAVWLDVDAEVRRREPPARPRPTTQATPGPEIPISLPAYERAFEPKLRWEAGRCTACDTLAFPPRYRCLECGCEQPSTPVSLPRAGSVYTCTTVHVPVPGMATPYSLAIVELDGVGVRALVQVTDAGGPEPVGIGDRGELVFRRVAVRTGVPDYGYAFAATGTDTANASEEDGR